MKHGGLIARLVSRLTPSSRLSNTVGHALTWLALSLVILVIILLAKKKLPRLDFFNSFRLIQTFLAISLAFASALIVLNLRRPGPKNNLILLPLFALLGLWLFFTAYLGQGSQVISARESLCTGKVILFAILPLIFLVFYLRKGAITRLKFCWLFSISSTIFSGGLGCFIYLPK